MLNTNKKPNIHSSQCTCIGSLQVCNEYLKHLFLHVSFKFSENNSYLKVNNDDQHTVSFFTGKRAYTAIQYWRGIEVIVYLIFKF